jgi:4-hydroxyphenylacetate 3-monooxygenase
MIKTGEEYRESISAMIKTGEEYRESIRDGREVYINGEQVGDVASHPMFKPLVDVRARIYDMQHDAETRPLMTYEDDGGEAHAIGARLPRTQQDWQDKRNATDAVFDDIGGVVTRVGDETVGEMWSLYDAEAVLNEVDPQFSDNIRRHIGKLLTQDSFQVSANADPKGDRSRPPQEQDPDMLLHVVGETDAGIVVRGAKFETAAAYANQAFTKPTVANWAGDDEHSDYAVGFICDLGNENIKMICRTGFAGRAPAADYPLSNKFDEIDALVIFDDAFMRSILHRYSAFAFVQRNLRVADLMIGAALLNVRQTGLEKLQAVQENLARLACFRETINAHLTASRANSAADRSASPPMPPVSSTRTPNPGSTSTTASTKTGSPRTGASCWPSAATC